MTERPGESPLSGRASMSGLDVIAQNEGDLPRRREARDAAAEVVGALFRLVKLTTMHATDNLAVVQRVEEIVEAVRTYAARTGRNVSILFLDEAVFVGGLLLQANRASYDCARELGALLARVGAGEVGIARDARAADFFALANALGEALRAPRGTRAPERPSPRIRLRPSNPSALRREGPTDQLDPLANAANAYASACVVMRRLYEQLGKGQLVLPHRVKRVAQRLVDLSAGELPAFLGVTDAKRGGHDEAQRAVNASILTLAMARRITSDPVLLSRIAMAALLSDVGRFHVAGAFPGAGRVVPQIGGEQEARVPPSTAMLLTAMGRVNEPSVMRTVMAYEACWVARRAPAGLIYDGARGAALQSYLIAVARAYVEAVTALLGSPSRTADEAIASLAEKWSDGPGKTAVRLLIGALGLFPSGTLVELSSGEVAAVVATPADPALYSMPRVRVVLDMAGHPVDPPFEVDLASQPSGAAPRAIRRVVTSAMDVAPVSVRVPPSSSMFQRSRSTSLPPAPQPSSVRVTEHPGAMIARPAPITTPPTVPDRPAIHEIAPPARRPSVSSTPPSIDTLASACAPQHEPHPPLVAILSDMSDVALPELPPEASDPEPPPREQRSTMRSREQKHDEPSAEGLPMDEMDLAPSERQPLSGAYEAGDSLPAGAADPDDSRTRTYTHEDERLVAQTMPPPEELLGALVEPTRPAPMAEGTFARTPLVHLLVYILDQRLTGTATFFPPDGLSHDVYFEDGVAAKIRTGAMIWPLDRVLVNLRMVDEPRLNEALVEISRRKMLLGRYLVTRGLCSRDDVLRALRLQLVHKLVSLCDLPAETKYAFYSPDNLIASYGGPELLRSEPLSTILAAVRASASHRATEATLARIAHVSLGFVPGADIPRFGFSQKERAVCDLLRAKRMRWTELITAGVAPENVVKRTIYTLVITRCLDLGAAQKPPVAGPPLDLPSERPPPAREPEAAPPAPQPPPAAPKPAAAPQPPPAAARPPAPAPTNRPATQAVSAKAPADVAARRAEVQARAASIDNETFFEVLGITRSASSEDVRNAYFSLAKRWHPDRTPPELVDLKPQVATVFARIGEAYATLNDPEKRAAYVKSLESPAATARTAAEEEQVVRAVNAALEYQKAEVLLKKHDIAGAERHIRLAADADPGQPEYTTLLAWVLALRRGEPKDVPAGGVTTHYDDLISMLDEVLRGDPQYEKALFYRGTLLKRSGKVDKAIRDFRLAADQNPKNIDAVREVRLYEMRRREQKAEPADQGGGLFGKWFKR